MAEGRHTRVGRANQNVRRCALVTCCGKSFPGGFLARHQRGLLHSSSRVVALLKQNCLTHRQIGERLGVSAERVRQVAEHFGLATGLERKAVCAINRGYARSRKMAEEHPLAGPFKQECVRAGLSFELVPRISNPKRYEVTVVAVNGRTVRLRRSSYNANGYCQFHGRSPRRADFIAYLLPDSRWLLLPWEKVPLRQTSFALEPAIDTRGLAYSNRHDYREFINAWNLLRSKTQTQAA